MVQEKSNDENWSGYNFQYKYEIFYLIREIDCGNFPPFPEGDLSFLYEIPAIGTKFKQADKLGPNSQKGIYGGHGGDENYPIKLWFDFR